VARAHQQAEVLGGRLHRHAGERHAVAPRREGDLQHPRRQLGVLIEHFVEVADPVEEDGVGALCLHLAPVLQHRRDGSTGGLAAHGRHGEMRGDWRDIRWRI
jgi:hypothetical protein